MWNEFQVLIPMLSVMRNTCQGEPGWCSITGTGAAITRRIVATSVVNDLVNHAGITFVFQAVEETGATPQDVVRAYSIAREAFGLKDYWREVAHLDMQVPTEVQDSLSLQGRRIVGRAVRWLLRAHHHR